MAHHRHRWISLASLALATFAQAASGQEIETTADRAMVVTSGSGEVMLTPDRATVAITIRTIAPTADEASDRNRRAAEAVAAVIETLQLEPDSLRSTGVRVGPNREYTPEGPRDNGYFAERGLRVTTADLSAVGRIVQAAVGAGATEIDHVAYASSREEEARREALGRAVRRARSDAEVVATAAGGRLGRVILLSTQAVSVPQPVFRGGRPNASPMAEMSIPEPEDLSVTAYVQGHWEYRGEGE